MMLPKKNINQHNLQWPQISDHPYRILITGSSGSGKANSLFNLINQESDIDNFFLSVKDPYKTKYQFLINKQESTGFKAFY